jgi:hypothetical protein
MILETNKPTSPDAASAPTGTRSQPTNVLTQSELKAWWPFTRLDPRRMPKPEREECLL